MLGVMTIINVEWLMLCFKIARSLGIQKNDFIVFFLCNAWKLHRTQYFKFKLIAETKYLLNGFLLRKLIKFKRIAGREN